MSPPGPMAKHPSTRQRRNVTSTAREIVLRGDHEALLPVPPLPAHPEVTGKNARPAEWHPDALVAWAEMWQYPLVYQAPAVDHHLIRLYIRIYDAVLYKLDRGESVTELIKEIRPMAEMWGFGEKSRRHLQITTVQAEEAMDRGVQRAAKRVDASAVDYTPQWTQDDEDDGSIADADVVA
jgi:hypothetical protein